MLVDSSRHFGGDPGRMVDLFANVEGFVIWLSERLKFPHIQVHGDMQEIHYCILKFGSIVIPRSKRLKIYIHVV